MSGFFCIGVTICFPTATRQNTWQAGVWPRVVGSSASPCIQMGGLLIILNQESTLVRALFHVLNHFGIRPRSFFEGVVDP